MSNLTLTALARRNASTLRRADRGAAKGAGKRPPRREDQRHHHARAVGQRDALWAAVRRIER
jgi:hypothetical protein